MRFRLDVVLGNREPQVIELQASSAEEARHQAISNGFSVLSTRSRTPHWTTLLRRRSLSSDRFDVLVFVEQLRDLVVAGLSVIEALTALRDGSDSGSNLRLNSLSARLLTGDRLSDALDKDSAFPVLLVAMVRAAELTSDLPRALDRYLEHERRIADIRHKVVSVAIYPALLLLVGSSIMVFLLFYVMPRFARIFNGMNTELPWTAQAMVWWSQWLSSHPSWTLSLSVMFGLAVGAILAPTKVRSSIIRWALSWEPLRRRTTAYFLARWYRATGMLVQGGIPLPEALRMSNDTLPLSMQVSGKATERSVQEGYSPAVAFIRSGVATPVAAQLLRAGEQTGDLGSVLIRIAQFHESEVARSVEKVMRAIEPIIMVAIGIGVGAVVILMYLPIFELASSIQ